MFNIFCYLFHTYYNKIPNEVKLVCKKLKMNINSEKFENCNYDSFPYIIPLKVFFISLFEKTLDLNSLKGMFVQLGHMIIKPWFFVEVLYHIFSKKRTVEHSQHV